MILGIEDGKFQLCWDLIKGFGPADIPLNAQALVDAIIAIDPSQQGDPWVDFSLSIREYQGVVDIHSIIDDAIAILKK